VGFDDISEAAYFSPPLSSIRQDHLKLGTVAVQEVVKLIEADQNDTPIDGSKTIMLTPTLAVRESSVSQKEVNKI
jgi:DNA-binding LacI/PurR family transcriptional regulator